MEQESSIGMADKMGVVIFLTTVGAALVILLADSFPAVIGIALAVPILVLALYFLTPIARACLGDPLWSLRPERSLQEERRKEIMNMERKSSIAMADMVGVVIFLTTVGAALVIVFGDRFPPLIGIAVAVPILVLAWHFLTPIARAFLRARRWLGSRVLAHERVAGFLVPNNVSFHAGHAWAKLERKNIVTVGMDDFAVKLLGSVDSISLPAEGSKVKQGSSGWLMMADGQAIRMLSPVDGKVVAVNDAVAKSPGVAFEDPYGNGWLFKVKSNNWISNRNNMIVRDKVGEWLEGIRDNLAGRRWLGLATALAPLCADGGEAIPGMAKAVDPDGWDDLVREFFLTK